MPSMHRIPANGHWKEEISPHVLGPLDQISGMICIEHFLEADILPATKSQPIRLKKGAVPSIFKPFKPTERQTEHIATIDVPSVSSVSYRSDSERLPDYCENCQCLEVHIRELKQIHLVEEKNSELKILKLETQIEKLLSTVESQSDRIKRMNDTIASTRMSKENFKSQLNHLKQQQQQNKRAVDVLQVHIVQII